jgi:DNA polymerase-3 subunit epsilon
VDLDLIWNGTAVPAATLESWLETPFSSGHGVIDGRGVLERHGTDCWSQAQPGGEALIRIPLPPAEPPSAGGHKARPPRPEFYDFELVHHAPTDEALRDRPLRALSYVVFDVETTGLRLSEGDVPVSIGAVRVVNGRVLPLETFERLINPGRAIPAESVRFHGITDDMVKDKPPLSLVLPQFQRFAADSILIAHNAAFDMLALQRGGAVCGVTFDNPVLDTLLISAWLDKDETEHSLDAIARRLGLPVSGRHDAMGDAMLTAAILVRQLDRLEAAGIERFGQLVAATDMAARLRANQMQF